MVFRGGNEERGQRFSAAEAAHGVDCNGDSMEAD